MKNTRLRRYPAASPSCRRGKKSLLIRRDATPHPSPCQARGRLIEAYARVGAIHELPLRWDFGRSRKRDFAKLNLHPGIFDQPSEIDFSRLQTYPLPFAGEGQGEGGKSSQESKCLIS
jgi:hypothetical protein